MTDNLRIWSKVEKTNPAHTKKVNQRGGFTAISAAFQIKNATEQFGPIGIGWGYTTGTPIITETLMTVPVSLWHGDRANVFGPMLGCEEWKDKNGRVDSDAPKKAVTDGLTKLLSQLGFNADVFLGRFDDSKYVVEMEREFAATIHQDQADALRVEIEAVGADTAKFLAFFKVPKLEALPAGRWNEAVAMLEAKRMKKAA